MGDISSKNESYPPAVSGGNKGTYLKGFTPEQIEVLLRSIEDLVFVLDNDRNFVLCFQPENSELPASLFSGKNISTVPFPTEVMELLETAFDAAAASGHAQTVDYGVPVHGMIKWYNAKVSVIGDNIASNGFIVVARDVTKWKESILKEQVNEEKYHLLADNTTDLVALYNPDNTILYISPSVYKLLGYEPASLTGIDPSPYIHPDDQSYMAQHFKPELFTADASFSFEYRLMHANGSWVYFSSNRRFIRDETGKVTHILACCRDITEKVESDAALKKSEAHYRLLADNILDLIGLHDITGVFEYVSPSALTVLGYAPEELVGKNAFSLIHPDESAKLFEANSNKTRQGTDTFMDEFRIMHKNGHYIHFETTTKIIRNEDSQALKFLSTSRNITEWKQAQCALKESEEKYRCLVESSDNMIVMVDCNCTYLFANTAAAKFAGTTPENFIGRKLGEISNSADTQFFITNIQRVIKEERIICAEDILAMNGTEYWLRISYAPIRNSEGKIYAVLLNGIDITNLKNSESLLEEQNKGLREIAFLQSHVLRSPLSNIKHLISLLDRNTLCEENKIIFDLLKVSADNLDDVVRQIVEKTYLRENKD